ncbi:hypothetical protein SCHPADRAFT_297018 [Schizopora paradoxa]|uniref:Uncharacterized protein n=1 Tax=Schizopora paradoxa TaxID=27342 RepID=A0A0H2SCQ6_9AGAM|nr:hypothetical protein SCHPADRAFT_297018 [Schizopora paradoxa]
MAKSGFARYILRVRMVALFLAAVGVMILHHLFCRYLNKKPVNYEFFANPAFSAFIVNYYGSIGNTLSIISKAALCSALAIVFVQIFWYQHLRRKYSIGQIDKAVLCKDDPLASLISFRSTTVLSMITFLGVSMFVVTIFAPGALKPESRSLPRDCTVPTVNLETDSLAVTNHGAYSGPISQLRGFVANVVLSGTYLSPNVTYDSYGSSTSYNINFTAPALNCTNITSTYDFARNLPLPASFTAGEAVTSEIVIWNGTKSIASDGLTSLVVGSRKLIPLFDDDYSVTADLSPSAATCVAYSGVYHVTVTTGSGDGAMPYVILNSVDLQSPISELSTEHTEQHYYAVVDSLFSLMAGTAVYDPGNFDFTLNSVIIAYSPIGSGDPDSPWSFARNIVDALPEVMGNVSISILSGILSQTDNPSLMFVPSVCYDDNEYFIYHPKRLFFSYGAGLLVTAFCIGLGFLVIRLNGTEEYLVFSQILRTLPGGELSPAAEEKPLADQLYFS